MKELITQNPDGTVDLTAPVFIPGVPDCDFSRGEPPLTSQEIRNFAESYKNYQFIDSEHELERNGRKRGKPTESFILAEDSSFKLLNGDIKTYPEGTWMLSANLTDPEAIQTALNGGYSGWSPTVKNRRVADEYKAALKSQTMTYAEMISACKSFSGDGLIKDVVDPVVLSVSLTGRPCQEHSKFCKHKLNGEKMTKENDVKTKVLAALGMTGEAEVTALKSQVNTLEDKIDDLEGKFESSLKSMEESFGETLKEALKEVGSSKSTKKPEDPDDNNSEGGNPNPDDTNEGDPNPEDPEDDSSEGGDTNTGDENKPRKKNRGSSKSRPLHNNSNNEQRYEKDTYKAMGRNPDGTAKSI